jgi:hypothetical protein
VKYTSIERLKCHNSAALDLRQKTLKLTRKKNEAALKKTNRIPESYESDAK